MASKEVEEGSSFATKAVLYSKDPGSSSNGGYYKMNRKTPLKMLLLVFSKVRYLSLETDFGFHIIYVEKIKGQEIELRHILLTFSI
jgi:peptidyl-prolyl cis-trans isomerase SurA